MKSPTCSAAGKFQPRIARRGAQVVGVEGSESLVRRAEENAARNGLSDRSRFFAADLYADPQVAMKRLPGLSKVLIDPRANAPLKSASSSTKTP